MSKVCSPKDLNKDSIELILQEHFNDYKLKVTSVIGDEILVGQNENFNSQIKKWTAVAEKNVINEGEKTTLEVSLVVKSNHQTSIHRIFSPLTRPFGREVFWYSIAYPELAKIYTEVASISPVCYYGYSNYTESMVGQSRLMERLCCMLCWPLVLPAEIGIILLDNLCAGDKKLKVLDKNKVPNYQQARIVFETLAKFHGVWLKWRHQAEKLEKNQTESSLLRPEDTNKLKFAFKPWMVKSMFKSTSKIVSILLQNQNVPNEIIGRFEKYSKTKLLQRVIEISDAKHEATKSKILTICHGDAWSNNMMFSQDDDHMTLIDFQLIGLHHPATDLWYFLSVNTDKEFRAAYLPDLLRQYFSIFKTYLEDVNIKMSFEEFLLEFEERRDAVFGWGFQAMPNVLSPHPISLDGLDGISKMNRKREMEVGGDPKPEDHPMVVEIRRRLVEIVLEAAEVNFF